MVNSGLWERVHPLVPEVLADLVDALEPAHDQPLEVQLVRDPEEHLGVERLVARLERAREGPAVHRLQDGSLHLEEPAPVEDRRIDATMRERRKKVSRLSGLMMRSR